MNWEEKKKPLKIIPKQFIKLEHSRFSCMSDVIVYPQVLQINIFFLLLISYSYYISLL